MAQEPLVSDQAPGLQRGPASRACEAERIAKDLRLVAEYDTGNELALRRFSERMLCVPRILTALNSRMGRPLNSHDIEDLVQQTLLIVLRKLHEFQGLSSIEGWAYRICFLEFSNSSRRKVRESVRHSSSEVLGEALSPATPPCHQHEDLHRALERLPEEERAIVHMKHFGELTFEAISRRAGTKLSTVKARYYRGINLLRQVEELNEG